MKHLINITLWITIVLPVFVIINILAALCFLWSFEGKHYHKAIDAMGDSLPKWMCKIANFDLL